MDNPGYVTLSRQSGLLKNMQIIANNIANMSTDGFRREGAIFAEMVDRGNVLGGAAALTEARVRVTDFSQGVMAPTGGTFDFAIEGEGFFMVETPDGQALTRAGSFARSAEGEIVTKDGNRVLDEGGAPLFATPDAREITVATDGTLSADGQPVGRLGVVNVPEPEKMTRAGSGLFTTDQDLIPAENTAVFQGFIEKSNVDPVREIARMIEVQRAYEMGQNFLNAEDERIRQAVRTVGGA